MAETHIQGTVLRLTFRNEDNGYTVAKIRAEKISAPETAVVGNFASIDVGEYGIFTGEWINKPPYGKQFAAKSFDPIMPSTPKGIERLLSKGKFHGIGKVYAKKIVEHFGVNTVEIIENNPIKLMEVPGIGKERAEKIKTSWDKKKNLKNINLFLAENSVPLHFGRKIYAKYKEKSINILRNNPYQLTYDIRGIAFKTADSIALGIGMKEDSNDRIQAAIVYILREAASEGHTFLPKYELIEKSQEFLNLDIERILEQVKILDSANRIVIDLDKIYIRYWFSCEQQIVIRFFEILKRKIDNKVSDIDSKIDKIEQESGIKYTERQREAIKQALFNKVTLITGGPGTGKTTIIRGLLKLFQAQKIKVMLAAPTGRAAKRMEEACGVPAQTIHRLLDYNPQNGKFSRNLNSPLDTDALIIDETSMIDTSLMASLLYGIDNNAHLVLVGDADQLPSVGPGNVFRNIIDSITIPVIRLDVIFRQSDTSNIVNAAHNINNCTMPETNNGPDDNYFFIYEDNPELIADKIAGLVKNRLPAKYGFDPLRDIQVLTPMYKSDTGVLNINNKLQQALNPHGDSLKLREREFRTGDKVMQIRNDYNKDVYNGDIGFISKIDPDEEELTVRFDSRPVSYDFSDLDQLVLAYAVTVHKSQGSEYKAVIMPITTQHYIMLQKNLLYTAVTRARELMILIGTKKALNIAVKNNKTTERYTFLEERLKNPEKPSTQLDLMEPSAFEV